MCITIHVSNRFDTNIENTRVCQSNRFDTCIFIHVSDLTRVSQYTCQTVQLMTCTSDTRLTRVKMHVSNCLTRVRHCTRVKLHVAICMHFCSEINRWCLLKKKKLNYYPSERDQIRISYLQKEHFQMIFVELFIYLVVYIL
jgi:hypothetical protein